MRVYHFVNEEFGLDDLRRRCLKIATLNELNDPFELFGVNLGDERLRRAFAAMKQELALSRGLLCFSCDWRNPVQWSHYAAKHTGLCLGFDVPDKLLGHVTYSRRRLVVDLEQFHDPRQIDVETAKRFLFTKYSHWRYENEVRCFVTLKDKDAEADLYFADFSEDLHLRQVVVGAQSKVSRIMLKSALGELASTVECFKARLAFESFRVVRQNNEELWI
jgi:hypothetical protein